VTSITVQLERKTDDTAFGTETAASLTMKLQ
jgi:hypothetical protein